MAFLPGAAQAIVPDAKLTDYLLNPAHPRGAAKARFLFSFGFALNNLQDLRAAFIAHAALNEIAAIQTNAFGTIFEIEGPLPSPDGRNPIVRAVWMLESDASVPRLITMVPMRRKPDGEPRDQGA